jgi:hypothetical protein
MQNQTPSEQADYSAWILVLQILGSSLQSVSGYLQGQQLRTTIGTQAGYYGVNIPNRLTAMQFEAMVQQYRSMYPSMSEAEIRQRLAWVFNQEYQGGRGSWTDNIPSWALPFGAGLIFVYLIMKKKI